MTGRDDVLEQLRPLLDGRAKLPPGRELTADMTLEQIDIDSVDLAFVFAHFERHAGVSFADDEVDVGRYATVGDLADALGSKRADAA